MTELVDQSDDIDHISPVDAPLCCPKVETLLGQVQSGFKRRGSLPPTLAKDGCGGAYFLPGSDGQSWAAVFKPTDEEPGAPNNPKKDSGQVGPSPRNGIRAGEAAVREFAAFLLDHEHFAGVPPTGLVECCHRSFGATAISSLKNAPKRGSLQAYVTHDFDAGDVGAQRFPVAEVHKIGILDIRLCNCDRHGGNLLVVKHPLNTSITSTTPTQTNTKQQQQQQQQISTEATTNGSTTTADNTTKAGQPYLRLVPIDHGFCLPDRLDEIWFEWLHWPQASVPFDKETKRYIAALDPEKDIKLLESHGLVAAAPDSRRADDEGFVIRHECIRGLKIATMLLQKCAKRGLTLFQIGRMMCRTDDMTEPSVLEQLVAAAEQKVSAKLAKDSKAWEASFFRQLDGLISQAAKHPPQVGNRRHSM